jgi:organic hydroperoxide reductase OsmC/OhrA
MTANSPTVNEHRYSLIVRWTGNTGAGTSEYRAYGRDHVIEAPGKAPIAGSSDPHFRGDAARWNPEELLLASLATCHQLWYLHLCADAGVVVSAYEDHALGCLRIDPDGGGRFTHVLLRPKVRVASEAQRELALALHHRAHALCFIARSVNFPVEHEPTVEVAS